MAVLEKIRVKFGLVISIIIALALLSFIIEEVLLFVLVEKLLVSEYIAKWPVAVLVVIINYAFGKLLVFRKRDENGRIVTKSKQGSDN